MLHLFVQLEGNQTSVTLHIPGQELRRRNRQIQAIPDTQTQPRQHQGSSKWKVRMRMLKVAYLSVTSDLGGSETKHATAQSRMGGAFTTRFLLTFWSRRFDLCSFLRILSQWKTSQEGLNPSLLKIFDSRQRTSHPLSFSYGRRNGSLTYTHGTVRSLILGR